MTKLKFADELYDMILEKVNIPIKDRISVYNDLRYHVSIATLETIERLLNK